MKQRHGRLWAFVSTFALIAIVSFALDRFVLQLPKLASGLSVLGLVGVVASIIAVCGLASLATHWLLALKRRPPVEGAMIARLYWLLGIVATIAAVLAGLDVISTVGGFVTSLLGRIPQVGDAATYRNLRFTIRTMRKRRIGSLHLERLEDAE